MRRVTPCTNDGDGVIYNWKSIAILWVWCWCRSCEEIVSGGNEDGVCARTCGAAVHRGVGVGSLDGFAEGAVAGVAGTLSGGVDLNGVGLGVGGASRCDKQKECKERDEKEKFFHRACVIDSVDWKSLRTVFAGRTILVKKQGEGGTKETF